MSEKRKDFTPKKEEQQQQIHPIKATLSYSRV